MKRTAILTLAAVTSVAFGSQAAQAHLLAGDSAVTAAKSSYSTSLSIMKRAGTKFHAQSSYGNQGVSPDNRGGIRGV